MIELMRVDMEDVTVLVSSCDKYSDLWEPFFTLLKKFWNPKYPIVLNTEAKEYSFDGLNITTFQLFKNEPVEWSKRLRETLSHIHTEYVLTLLDDFFLEKPVDNEKIEECIRYMNQDKNIAAFYFVPIKDEEQDNKYPEFAKIKDDGEYRLNCQAALWRKDILLMNLRDHESAWLFETLGSRRNRRWHKDQIFYCTKKDSSIFEYNVKEGGAVHRGKWNKHTVEMCKLNGIDIDTSIRGINTMVSGSRKSLFHYYIHRLSPSIIFKAIDNRRKSYR